MILDKLGSGLKSTFRKITGIGFVDKESVERIIRDLQRTLIQSDVDIRLVSELSNRIRDKVLKEKPPAGITLKEFFVKTLYDEIVNLLGEEKSEIELKKQKILLIGLFGSGKTSTAGKLAKWFKTRGLSVGLVACDTFRPAAKDQLEQLSKEINVKIYRDGKKPHDIAKDAIKKSKEDVLIFDSAGRNALDKELAKELNDLVKEIKPDETLLVIPADIGQAARKQTEGFLKLANITGVIITKMDGSAKGGGSLAATALSGAKVKFIGVGEKLGDLEEYDPQRFVSKLIGYGDIQGLLEKAKSAGLDDKLMERIKQGKFTLNEFMDQIKQMGKMGSLSSIAEMIPGLSGAKLPKRALDVQEEKMKRWEHMIKSMTFEEREDPEIFTRSRIERVAKGSGTKPEEVKELLKNYRQIKKMMKLASGKSMKRGMFSNLAKQLRMKM